MVVLAHHALWDLQSKANNLVQRILRLPLSPPPWDMVWFPRGRTGETLVSTSPGELHVLWGKGTFPRGTLTIRKTTVNKRAVGMAFAFPEGYNQLLCNEHGKATWDYV